MRERESWREKESERMRNNQTKKETVGDSCRKGNKRGEFVDCRVEYVEDNNK